MTGPTQPTYEQFTAIRRYLPALAFSPDGAHVAYSVNTSGQYNLWRQPSEGGVPRQVTLSPSQAVREIAWSPDGETIAFTADNDGDEFNDELSNNGDGSGNSDDELNSDGCKWFNTGIGSPRGGMFTGTGGEGWGSEEWFVLPPGTLTGLS